MKLYNNVNIIYKKNYKHLKRADKKEKKYYN